MYYQRNYGNYGNRYGGGYHNYSAQNSMMPHQQRKNPKAESCDTPKEFPLAMGYVPWQTWGNLYDPCEALAQGTIFKDLNFKFCG